MGRFKLDIVMVIPGMSFSGGSLKRHSLGGSETAAICMARELAKLGHVVNVFCNCKEPHTGGAGEYDGVLYKPLELAQGWLASCDHDVLIAQRNSMVFANPLKSKLNVLWNHDVAIKTGRVPLHGSLWNIDYITGLSKFHIKQQVETMKLDLFDKKDLMWQTRNGIDLKSINLDLTKKKRKQLLFSSRPERGLENLVKPGGIMEELYKVDPEINLVVAGYDHTVPEMKAYYEMLWARIEELPNCRHAGALPKHRLYKLMAESSIYVYPSDFEEISCITAMEIMRSKMVWVGTDIGAIKETAGEASILLSSPSGTEEYQKLFVQNILRVIEDTEVREELSEKGYERTEGMGWDSVAKEWEEKFLTFFKNQTANKKRLCKHFIYNEDVIAGVKANENSEKDDGVRFLEVDRVIKSRKGMINNPKEFNNDYFSIDGPKLKTIEDCVSYVNPVKLAFIDAFIKDDKIKTVLDFGCDIGQYTFSLAKEFPNKCFVGMDISDVKIDLLDKLPPSLNLSFIQGDEHKGVKPFDLMFVNEVIEYQQEPWTFVDGIESKVEEGGRVIICVATGPWGKAINNGNSYRLWNFDRQDIRDMFRNKKEYAINMASAGSIESTGESIGWFFISYKKDTSIKTGEIDMERKLNIQRPRQSLAVSMIVKNSEGMLHRTLKSVEELADEIIVVDTGSDDSTKAIAKQYTHKVYAGSDPLIEGFEVSRNETLKYIDSDWILWIDSDEVLLRGENIRKYIRDNVYNGYSIKQHHFSAVPPNIFTPDLPVRLFRTDRNIKWFGIIHEHVEIELNKSIETSNLITDVDIGHDGYLTEDIRRKRFDRNYKLLMRDREKYPERRLGKFLKIRDDVHLVRYGLEKTRGLLNTKLVEMCEDIIKDIREDFLGTDDHYQMDGIGFYSEALGMLKRGFEIKWCIAAAKVNPEFKTNDIATFRFENKKDVEIFFASKLKNMTEMFEGKYCGY